MTEMRFDPIRGEWVAFASHRQDRTFLPAEDHCPLCPTRDPQKPTEIPRAAFDEKLKYLAGSELGAGAFLNDVLPEEAARQLRTAVEHGDSSGD